ncbi:MAG: PIG-L family deacetylase, partial [Ferruginibacter sp.]|nr:PIG-L family deacetylase [Ferruginibacter sp.]
MKKCFVFIIMFLLVIHVKVQSPAIYSSADILQQMKKLEVFGSVLYVAAHPDDENTRLLGYMANERKFRTGYLSLTRGDGGQNLIGDEQGIDLGLIRTQELLSARRIDGAEQFLTRAFDFGYSKNPEEAMRIWEHDKILADVVWVIRKFKPDVIITRFPTTGEGGHGHHTASAILAGEAFDAAADPNKFKEQLKFVKIWQAKRLLWNTFNFGGNNTTREDQFKIDCGVYNPVLGKSYGEIAAESRSRHKSQGFGVTGQRGKNFEYFTTIKGEKPVNDLMEGVDSAAYRTTTATEYFAAVKELIKKYDYSNPKKSVSDLEALSRNYIEFASLMTKEKQELVKN